MRGVCRKVCIFCARVSFSNRLVILNHVWATPALWKTLDGTFSWSFVYLLSARAHWNLWDKRDRDLLGRIRGVVSFTVGNQRESKKHCGMLGCILLWQSTSQPTTHNILPPSQNHLESTLDRQKHCKVRGNDWRISYVADSWEAPVVTQDGCDCKWSVHDDDGEKLYVL